MEVVLKFDNDHKVIPETLTRDEAVNFVHFLTEELDRHNNEYFRAEERENEYQSGGQFAGAVFWESAKLRHGEDCEATQNLIHDIKERFGL